MDKKLRNIIIYITVAVMVVLGVAFLMTQNSSESYTTSQLVNLFKEDKVQSYTVNYGTGAIEITLKEGVKLKPAKDIATSDSIIQDTTDDNITATDPDGKNAKSSAKNVVVRGTLADIERFIDDVSVYTASADEAVSYDYIKGSDNTLLYEFLPILVTGILFVVVWIFIMKKMGGGLGGKEMNFGKAKIKNTNDEKRKTTFEDVAGADEEKEELEEIVEFLKAPDKYNKLGARIPKGVLLVGPPGTGKTLLARAVAGEAGVPFFSISGSDFVEMFVGVGASRVRDLFEQAKKNSPCIIFIDEIDAVGRARGRNPNMGANDERENTLNQLLTEMDGFGTNSGIIVLAATNRVDILDKALLRAGRFDRQIYVDLPDLHDRKEIFHVHLRNVKIAKDVDVDLLSRQTPGFSGADIANVCNEAALIAARNNKAFVEKQDFMDAVDRIVGGLEKRSKITTEEERESIATHEAGHASISWHLKYANPLIKVTIVPRGKALGAAWYLPEERKIVPEQAMLDEICSLLGGRAAEEAFLGSVSTGALNDLERATKQAYAIVAYYGMSKELPNVSYYDSTGQDYMFSKPYSEDRAKKIDSEVTRILSEQYERAKALLEEYKDGHHKLRDLLLSREVIFTEDVENIFGKRKWASRADEIIKANEEQEQRRKEAESTTEQAPEGESKDEKDPLADDDMLLPPPVPEEDKRN